jgi:hypothetical protein
MYCGRTHLQEIQVVLSWSRSKQILIPAAGTLVSIDEVELEMAGGFALPLRVHRVQPLELNWRED